MFSKERENLLIIDTFLFQSIEIAKQWENNQDEEKRKSLYPKNNLQNFLKLLKIWGGEEKIIKKKSIN